MSRFDQHDEVEDEGFSGIHGKIEDLVESLSLSNGEWNEWETEFIESLKPKLRYNNIKLTPRQYEKMNDLWEKL